MPNTLSSPTPERPFTPDEQVARDVCEIVFSRHENYRATFRFGTPGGDDIDLRPCFTTLEGLDEAAIAAEFRREMLSRGVATEIDLLFMSEAEFVDGIRDLSEQGRVEERLENGFDPHFQQAAVGDTSLFSLYIFATMQEFHRSQEIAEHLSPNAALARLALTAEGGVGWSHFYMGSFLHTYLGQLTAKYPDRLAKYFSRVTLGTVVAQLGQPPLDALKKPLITAVREADEFTSTDATMNKVVLTHPQTVPLLEASAHPLLREAGEIRSGQAPSNDFTGQAEAALFYQAFTRGIDVRWEHAEQPDPLMSYALSELLRDMGEVVNYAPGEVIMRQGAREPFMLYIPLKNSQRQPNSTCKITVQAADGSVAAEYERRPGQTVGEAAVFGVPRSATVTADGALEAYYIETEKVRDMLASPQLYAELSQPVLENRAARRLDVLLRYFAIEAGMFVRQSQRYTTLGPADPEARATNPIMQYHLGQKFHDVLALLVDDEPAVSRVVAADEPRVIFEAGQENDRLYVVSAGTVEIPLQNGEHLTLQPGEFFGESSILKQPPTGTTILTPQSQVLSVDAQWFLRWTQSRQPVAQAAQNESLRGVLPVHMLYHLAAEGYERVRRRLGTQGRVG